MAAVVAVASVLKPNAPDDQTCGPNGTTLTIPFSIGTLVNVESRTWPGINKPGGVGRVTACNMQDSTLDVKYVLGGEEKGIEVEFVREHRFEGEDDDGNKRGGRASSRRRRSRDDSQKEQNADNGREEKRKRALKDASSQANQMKTETKQKPTRVSGTKRKNADETVNASKKITSQEKSKDGKSKQTQIPKITAKKSVKANNNKKTKKSKETTTTKDESKLTSSKKTKTKTTKTKSKAKVKKSEKASDDVQRSDVDEENEKKVNAESNSPTSSNSSTSSNRWGIPSPTRVLKNVYKDMVNGATSFVQEIVGKKESSTPSSPESTSSLEVKIEKG